MHKLLLPSYAEPEIYKEVKQKLDDGSVKFEVTLIQILMVYLLVF
jgi:hypothetical protein